MIDNEENIMFEQMPDFQPDWGQMMKPQPTVEKEVQVVETVEKEYATLYDELLDKCHIRNFKIESVGLEKFKVANDLYSALLCNKKFFDDIGRQIPENILHGIRDKAIDELGIYISAKKKFDYLDSLFNPSNYTNRQPYDKDLVAKAAELYSLILANKRDVRALEKLELENGAEFIKIVKDDEDDKDFVNLSSEEYLKIHPNGRHKEDATIKRDEKDKADFESMHPQNYLNLHPEGKYRKDAVGKLDDLSFNSSATPEIYLNEYPDGKHSEEARFYRDNHWWEYLKKYPDGKYAEDVRTYIAGASFVLLCIALTIIIVFIAH